MDPSTDAKASTNGIYSPQPGPSIPAEPSPAENIDDSTPPPPTTRDVADVPLSSFESRYAKLPDQPFTVAEGLAAIRDDSVAEAVGRIRAARGTPDYDRLKRGLRCITWAGTFSQGRKLDDPCEPSGLVFLELDFHDGTPARMVAVGRKNAPRLEPRRCWLLHIGGRRWPACRRCRRSRPVHSKRVPPSLGMGEPGAGHRGGRRPPGEKSEPVGRCQPRPPPLPEPYAGADPLAQR